MTGFYIGVDGKARKVKGVYIGVDGKARKVKKGYIGVDGVARLCYVDNPYDPVFANNSWENIIDACQKNAVPDTWTVGDQLTMNIDGKDYAIDIIGKNHDDYSDGSGKAPLTFQLHEYYAYTKGMHNSATNAVGWVNSDMRLKHLPELLKLMPVKTAIREVNKFTSAGNKSSAIVTTADKLFLLSEIEVFGIVEDSVNGEGNQYTYYSNGNSVKKGEGVNGWWTRSPRNGDTTQYVYVSPNEQSYVGTANTSRCVSFAFCF